MQADATARRSCSPGAERMRRTRSRRRHGNVIVTLEVRQGAIAALVALGWLPELDLKQS